MGQNILSTDTFNGVAGTVLHTYDPGWINATIATSVVDPKISTPNGGVVANAAASGSYRLGFAGIANQWAEAVLDTLSATNLVCVGVRMTGDGGNNLSGGYGVGMNPGLLGSVYALIDIGIGSAMTIIGTTPAPGDVLNIQVIGSQVTVRINGVIGDQRDDFLYTTGSPGLEIRDTTARFTSWRAGSVTADTVETLWARTQL